MLITSTLTGGSASSLVLDLALLALMVWRQIAKRPISSGYVLMLVLGGIGILEFGSFLLGQQQFKELLKGQLHHGVVIHHAGAIIAAVAGSLVIAAVSAVIRAPTYRVWREDGQVWRQGNAVTLGLWVASLAAHLLYDALIAHGKGVSGVGNATILLYFTVSLAVQRFLLNRRASRVARVA
jgi:hypothetical protein